MIKHKRRWVAWLTLINFVLTFGYLLMPVPDEIINFILGMLLLCYNYFIVRVVVNFPKGTLSTRQDSHLVAPLWGSILLAMFSVAAQY
ncbi:hypothetical protein J0676_11515 [Vibrio sp. Vb2880]|uniref:Uncharacterized protein n=1 Tax=Vibrio furnissii TaxID=29494 RepID=A0A0Q2XYW8_VIBFU|nr:MULTISPECIES: hypothetical protein [Vibrio]ADT87369.1 hypothetical protein vfu_A02231 [Vibrio furnissii NCTC 11218]EEX41967.1 hypothetical protein VFA_001809 [Vibrio furnissii CIP 102972]KQH85604.1 hypothetical protein AMR76_13975 [Vibrio furnissii]MBO0214128.1 hypothetical protein [Vibrio sp. Vb2880]MCG6211281.1 hypothetical protein [Vibrio furnissii]